MEKIRKITSQEEIFSKIIFESNKADSILDLIKKNIHLIMDFFEFEGGAIYFLEKDFANLFINFGLTANFVKDFTSITANSIIFKEVFLDKECFILDKKIKRFDILLSKNKEYDSLIFVPIQYHRRVIGCYLVGSKDMKKFSKKDLELMLLAGKEIGSFLEKTISDISIKKEKQNFQSFFNSMKDILFVLDKDRNIIEANAFACKRLFYSRNQLIRKNIEYFFPDDEKEKVEDFFSEEFIDKNTLFSSLEEKDGDIVPIEFSIIRGNWSERDSFFFIAKDISEKREVEIKLEESEIIRTSLMANIPNYVIVCNEKGVIRYANKSAMKVLGYKDFKFKKRSILDFVVNEQKKDLKNDLANIFIARGAADHELKMKNKIDDLFDVIISGSVIDYRKEKAILLILTDITNRKIAENLSIQRAKELENSQKALMNVLEDVEEEKDKVVGLAQDLEKFKLAVENTSDHIVITDKEGILLYANKGAEEMTGFSQEEIIGKKCGGRDTWGGLMSLDFYHNMWNVIKKDKLSFKGEVTNKRKGGGEYIAMATISPILNKDNDVQFFVGIERDITKEKEIDKAKSEFVSLASHQLRTPLSIINWYTELLLGEESGEINDEQKSYLQEIVDGNNRMVDLVGALLNVSRIEMGNFAINPKKIDIIKIAENILKELFIKFEAREVDLDFNYSKELPLMNFDPKLLGIIVDNLVGNAIKYTPDGGKVVFNILKDGKEVLFKVSDTGYGISNKDKPRIFTKLYRGENVQEKVADGNGLGLYIVKAIVDQSGGKVWFESEEGKGTTFFVRFPLSGMQKKNGEKEID
ncbi:MAG: PAS domain S-box protein [Candidatus Pacebacteria bacterium]|nr:PAS domain S-box protein [Candidatus Paceibacterota bacterium]